MNPATDSIASARASARSNANNDAERAAPWHTIKTFRMALLASAIAALLLPGYGWAAGATPPVDESDGMVMRSDSVAARLGGFPGILDFLRTAAAPAILSDPITGPFFGHLSETPDDIEECLAMLLDHDLGGSAPHFGAELVDGHQCRSSMTNIHRGRNIPDKAVDRFIAIVGEQATLAGVAPADIQAVAKVLERYRGGVRNK
jgi:hypothetical protein